MMSNQENPGRDSRTMDVGGHRKFHYPSNLRMGLMCNMDVLSGYVSLRLVAQISMPHLIGPAELSKDLLNYIPVGRNNMTELSDRKVARLGVY